MDQAAMFALVASAGGALLTFARWAVKEWSAVRAKAEVSADKRAEADLAEQRLARAESKSMHDAMVAAIIEQVRSNSTLDASVKLLGDRVQTLNGNVTTLGNQLVRMQRDLDELTPVPRDVPHQPSSGHRLPTAREVYKPRGGGFGNPNDR